MANGQRTTFHIQGIILRDGHAVQRQVAADARRQFQVCHVGDGKPAVVDQCAVHRQRSILSQRQQAGNCVFASGLGRYGTALIDCQRRLIPFEDHLATRAHGQAAVDRYAVARIEEYSTFQRQRPALGNGQGRPEGQIGSTGAVHQCDWPVNGQLFDFFRCLDRDILLQLDRRDVRVRQGSNQLVRCFDLRCRPGGLLRRRHRRQQRQAQAQGRQKVENTFFHIIPPSKRLVHPSDAPRGYPLAVFLKMLVQPSRPRSPFRPAGRSFG